ncbi:MAG TPA: EAL domain-containing protein [Gammaproteobacteria bacterium]|nr:EAL domain-containing protein [Gammaproteobacteria bacterium]
MSRLLQKGFWKKVLGGTSFRQQLATLITFWIIALALVASLVTSQLTSRSLEKRLIEQGLQNTAVLAQQSVLGLLYQSVENAQEFAETTLKSPDVLGVALFNADRQAFLEMGKIEFSGIGLETWPMEPALVRETDNELHYLAPVYSHVETAEPESPFLLESPEPELIGYVLVVMSKRSLQVMASDIWRGNFIAVMSLAVLLLLLLLLITRHLLRPLDELSSIMLRAESGDAYVRADIGGSREIGNMQHAFNTMMDVLEAREIELIKTRDMALESARMKGQFAANVTHELRTPLNGILGMLQLLDSPELTEQQKTYIETAQNSGEALLMLINDILDFSKIDAGMALLQLQDFEIRSLTGEIVELLKPQAEKKKIGLRAEIDTSIPEHVNGESRRIRQVLFNLVGNAVKFTHHGEVVVGVKRIKEGGAIHARSADEVILEFFVHDTGIGIAREAQARIFDAFMQADGSTSRNYGGTGLGLSISKQLVEFMGGRMGLESDIGHGSRFWFQLPFQKVTKNQEAVEEASEKPAPLSEGLRVLVVEDNRTNQQVAKGMLQRLRCTSDITASGEEALDRFETGKYDFILMDVQMPGMDGYQATRGIRSKEIPGTHVPIIAMTANSSPDDIEKALEAGMDDFLAKPFRLDTLRNRLYRWTGPDKDRAGATLQRPAAGEKATDRMTDVRKEQAPAVRGAEDALKVINLDSDNSVIDKKVFFELYQNAGPGFGEMLKIYMEDQPMYLRQIEQAIQQSDRVLLQRCAHTLKGSSRNFGATTFSNLCLDLEKAASQEDFQELKKRVKPIEKAAAEVQKELSLTLERLADTMFTIPEPVGVSKNGTEQYDPVRVPTIMVVDDDRSMLITMRTVLESDGYRIEEHENGTSALAACQQQLPDLVLMDALMPGIDGFKACKALRELPGGEHLPILIVTALEDENSIDRAFSAGANDFIAKPVNFAVLRQRIARLLDASQAEKHVRHLAYHDTLTGLPNRRTFIEKLRAMMNEPRDEGAMIAVMFMDLDRFKLVNDTLGHDAGDLLLQSVTSRIQKLLRSSDLVARLGGDEFTILLDHVKSVEVIAKIANKICQRLAEPFTLLGQRIYVSTSIGISIYPNDSLDVNTLIKYADTAMFKAKEMRNSFSFYETGMEKVIARRVELESEMRRALEHEEFTLHYQPQVDLVSGRIVGAEALVRWQHPHKGMVSPADFIPLAEETGLIAPLGEWVLKRACIQLHEWLHKGHQPVVLAVNISSRQLEDRQFVSKILSILQETGIPTDLLELEITESAIMRNPEEVIPALEELKRMGISLAIDDFGTGHSSLNYLRRFPVDTLKIDRSFVSDITKSPEDSVLINGIIALAKSLRLKVIAEGVETYEQKVYLQEQKCDWVQGYFLYKPMPAEIFEQQAFYKGMQTAGPDSGPQ